jgi:hypothetical protein
MYSITAKNMSLNKQKAESRRTQSTLHTQYQYTLGSMPQKARLSVMVVMRYATISLRRI